MTPNLPWTHHSQHAIRRESNPFTSLHREINRLFESIGEWEAPSWWPESKGSLTPSVDIVENDKSFRVEVELPGLRQEEVDVTVNDNYLTIRGEKRASKVDDNDNYIRRERYYGTYQRTVALPETADGDKAKATFKKGVLWVEIPKKAAAVAKTRKVEIKEAA